MASLSIAATAALKLLNALYFIRLLIDNFIYIGHLFVTLTVKSNRVDGKFSTRVIIDDNCFACEIRSVLTEQ